MGAVVWVIFVLLIVLLGVGAYFWYLKQQQDKYTLLPQSDGNDVSLIGEADRELKPTLRDLTTSYEALEIDDGYQPAEDLNMKAGSYMPPTSFGTLPAAVAPTSVASLGFLPKLTPPPTTSGGLSRPRFSVRAETTRIETGDDLGGGEEGGPSAGAGADSNNNTNNNNNNNNNINNNNNYSVNGSVSSVGGSGVSRSSSSSGRPMVEIPAGPSVSPSSPALIPHLASSGSLSLPSPLVTSPQGPETANGTAGNTTPSASMYVSASLGTPTGGAASAASTPQRPYEDSEDSDDPPPSMM